MSDNHVVLPAGLIVSAVCMHGGLSFARGGLAGGRAVSLFVSTCITHDPFLGLSICLPASMQLVPLSVDANPSPCSFQPR